MNKMTAVIIAALFAALMLFAPGCNPKVTTVEWGPTDTPTLFCTNTVSPTRTPYFTPTITPTSTSTAGVYVMQAYALEKDSETYLYTKLLQGSSSGPALTGASVTMGGQALSESTPGVYSYSNPSSLLFVSDTAVSLNISSSQGSVTASTITPKFITMTNPSTVNQSVDEMLDFTVQWSYPGGAPTGQIYIDVACLSPEYHYVQQNLPGATVSHLIPAATMTPGQTVSIELRTTNTSSITGAVLGSDDFMCVYQSFGSIVTTP